MSELSSDIDPSSKDGEVSELDGESEADEECKAGQMIWNGG